MSRSPVDEELRASLGLHRGRRAVALTAVILLGVLALGARSEQVEATEQPVAPEAVAPPSPVARLQPTARQPHKKRQARPARPTVVVEPARERELSAAPPPPSVAVAEPAPAAVEPAPESEPVSAPPSLPPPEPEPEPEAVDESRPDDGNIEEIARLIAASRRAAVRECFEHELKGQPTLTGNVVVELELAPPDRLEAVRVSDDLGSPEFTRCVTQAMQRARFSGLNEEGTAQVPYRLSPERR